MATETAVPGTIAKPVQIENTNGNGNGHSNGNGKISNPELAEPVAGD